MLRPLDELPAALVAGGLSPELEGLLSGRRPAIFLDYDGTLTPIVERPELAVLDPAMRAAVRRLAQRWPVALVSGRDSDEVLAMVGLEGLAVAGSHGLDLRWPGGGAAGPAEPEVQELIAEVTARLQGCLGGIPGVLLEPKRLSVAVHHRLVAESDRQRVLAAVEGVLAEHPSRLRSRPGRMVLELQADVDWDKGRAVLELLRQLGLEGPEVIPLYLGDDLTDEDAFVALRERGVGIMVGAADEPELAGRTTCARLRLEGVPQVRRLLILLAELAD